MLNYQRVSVHRRAENARFQFDMEYMEDFLCKGDAIGLWMYLNHGKVRATDNDRQVGVRCRRGVQLPKLLEVWFSRGLATMVAWECSGATGLEIPYQLGSMMMLLLADSSSWVISCSIRVESCFATCRKTAGSAAIESIWIYRISCFILIQSCQEEWPYLVDHQ